MTKLILLRHGQSMANLLGIGAGQLNYALSELGHEQAGLAADYLVAHETIDVIYSSDLQRAYDTARPTAERLGLPIIRDSSLREIDSGDWAGLTPEERKKRDPELFRLCREDFSRMRYPNGESVADTYRRVVPCICRIAKENEGKCILIAAHVGTIRVFHAFAQGYACDEVGRVPSCGNASISFYQWSDNTPKALRYNFTDHLNNQISAIAEAAQQ